MYQSLVVEANFIFHLFVKDGIIGKGKDPIYGVPSSIYKIKKHDGESDKYVMQVYEKIGKEIYDAKVQQLQKAMTIYTTPYTTRIILIGKEQLHQNEFDLYVVYEYKNIAEGNLLQNKEGLEQPQALKLLSFFCHNYVLQARFTYEFLDISPQNVFKGEEYVMTNFALNYAGTKFHRRYNPTTDPSMKEKKIMPINVAYQYAFKAALVTLCCMTKIDPKDLFFEDGQFKEQLLDNLLYLLDEKPVAKDKKQNFISTINQFFTDKLICTKDEDEKAQRRASQEQQFQYQKSENILQHKYTKDFLDILKKLLNVSNIQSRSIFQFLISAEENILKIPNPYFEVIVDKNNFVAGTGDKEKQALNGCGRLLKNEIQSCGQFKHNKPSDSFTEELKLKDGSIKYILYGLKSEQKWLYDQNKFLFIGQTFNENHEPEDDYAITAPINTTYRQKRETIYCYIGKIEKGRIFKGKSYQNDQSIFEGVFDERNYPKTGTMTYTNQEIFTGDMEGFNKKKGSFVRKHYKFEGEFLNDQMSQGVIIYKDGGMFYGKFVNGQQSGNGIYRYPYFGIQYIGKFVNDVRHGPGKFEDKTIENCVQNVVYNEGKCMTQLNEHFTQKLQVIKLKLKENPNNQQEDEDD